MFESIDSGYFVIFAFLTFMKAFNTVDHKISLSKFDFYGIRGVSHEWLQSKLSERNQTTLIDGITTSSSSIKSYSSTRVCPRSVIVSIIYESSSKLVFLIQVLSRQYSVDFVCWRNCSGIYINS